MFAPILWGSWYGAASRYSGDTSRARFLRKRLFSLCLGIGLVPLLGSPVISQETGAKTLSIGLDAPLTGSEAEEAIGEMDGARLAIEEANSTHLVPGYTLVPIQLSDATVTAGGYDPAQAAINARKFAANPSVVAIVGPVDSGAAKAMLPILAQADLPMVAGSTTSPDLTSPQFAPQFRANGVRVIFFRTCANEAFVEPAMVNYFYSKQGVKSVYVVDDGGAGGVALADSFETAAKKKGKVLGHDSLNPKEADYTTILTKIKGLGPDLLFLGGITSVGAKLAKQAYDILPSKVLRGDGGGIYGGDFLSAAGFPAAEGWFANSAAPHVFDTPEGQAWARRFFERWHQQPSDYNLTTYGAGLVVVDAIARVVRSGQPVSRVNVSAAIRTTNLKTIQGPIEFDQNGDLRQPVISVYRVTHDAAYPDSDVRQFKYVGTASP
jgi:branched-chain amino acid transport system substrate-binding protein